MQFVTGIPFDEAVEKLGSKSLIVSKMKSSEWADVPAALRERAFFSSQVESARVLQRGRDLIGDFLQSSKETLPSGETALKAGSRGDFVNQMKEFMAREGIDRTSGDLKDITSESRLGLIFETQTRQANDYGYWREGQDPDTLDAFPAQRFIRVQDVKEPRDSHTQYEDQVYLKNDPIWALEINEDFGVPWGPWAWGCGHDVEDVGRDEAEQLGLLQPGQAVEPDEKNFNENLQASTRGLDPDLVGKLQDDLGDQLVIDDGMMKWKEQTFHPERQIKISETESVTRQEPVSNAFDFSRKDITATTEKRVRDALRVIDSVHDDGTLPTLPVRKVPRGAYYEGAYVRERGTNRPLRMEVPQRNRRTEHIVVHETAHFLDHRALGKPLEFASQSHPIMQKWREAVQASAPIQAMQEQFKTATGKDWHRLEYLLRGREIFARSYSQWITERSGSAVLQKQFDNLISTKLMGEHAFWTKGEFEPIAAALEEAFKTKGWL